jgi:hypothetical protein
MHRGQRLQPRDHLGARGKCVIRLLAEPGSSTPAYSAGRSSTAGCARSRRPTLLQHNMVDAPIAERSAHRAERRTRVGGPDKAEY